MATAVVGFRPRERWSPAVECFNDDYSSGVKRQANMSPDASTNRQRGYSEALDHSARPRLPPISNFLQGLSRSEISSQSRQRELQTVPLYQTEYASNRPVSSSSAGQNPWSPQDDIRHRLLVDQRPPFHSRQVSEQRFYNHDYNHQSGVPVSQVSNPTAPVPPYPASSAPELTSQIVRPTKHVLREELVPGKGLCYVYDDGTICQKIINGDMVNPKWGTTKAGKPRKRLGQACNTCREKKIKCDPSFLKCTQCQKFNRECRFDSTPKSSQKSPKAPVSHGLPSVGQPIDETSHLRRSSAAPTEVSTQSESSNNATPRNLLHEEEDRKPAVIELVIHKMEEEHTPSKRARLQNSPNMRNTSLDKPTGNGSRSDRKVPLEELFSIETDPLDADKNIAKTCLDIYFSHSEALKHCIVPRQMFMTWFERDRNKDPASKLLIYCMLAWACVLEHDAERAKLGKVFSEIAFEGVMQPTDQFSLPLIQARSIFCIHEFQIGNYERAWELCGSALRIACGMDMNTEMGIEARCNQSSRPYDLEPHVLAESMRRTFWSLFQLDRFGVFCLEYGTPFNRSSLFLRIPCSEEMFASGRIVSCPIFDGEDGLIESVGDDTSAVHSTLVHRVQIVSLCCDVHSFALRSKHLARVGRTERTSNPRHALEQRLDAWEREYSRDLQRKRRASGTASADGPEFGGLHMMYHHASMALHRHVHHAHMTQDEIEEHVEKAHRHARRALEIAQKLMSHGNTEISDYHIAADDPITGYAVLTAIDIVTAAGLMSDLMEYESKFMGLVMPGIELIDRLAISWVSAKDQQDKVMTRISFFLSSVQTGVTGGKTAFYFTYPIGMSLGVDDDLIYGLDRIRYLQALGFGGRIRHESDLLQVRIGKPRRA